MSSINLVKIPAGSFLMGSPLTDAGRLDFESPQRLVHVPEFFMSQTQITQLQWSTIMGNNPSYFIGDDLPVDSVSWAQAKEFCAKLSEQSGKLYRLPTESEWEYACRGGSNTAYCFGDDESRLGDYAWYDVNSDSQTHPVGTKKPNEFGLFDMHGNVWEYCWDSWYDNYEDAPCDGSPRTGDSPRRVARGGSWFNDCGYCRSAVRVNFRFDAIYYDFGFRVVASSDSF